MTQNNDMHPRNPYRDKPPDFKALALEYPDFRKYCHYVSNGKVTFDFSKDAAVRCLTKTLLKNDFELEVDLPAGYLVPRVPQKLNYCLLIDDLLQENKISDEIVGIDIGTGTSAIHALIGARRFGWKFVATDGDETSVRHAHENVARNNLHREICVVRVNPEVKTVLMDVMNTMGGGDTRFAFCMCNPPFFERHEKEERFCEEPAYRQMAAFSNRVVADDGRRAAPHSATFASAAELCVDGGEVAFVNRIIDDSVLLRDRIKIYTTMLGRKQSVKPLQQRLQRLGDAVKFRVSTLSQGKTKRWMLAWTFADSISLAVDRPRPVSIECSKPDGVSRVCRLFDELDGRVRHEHPDTLIVEFRSATWIHRRARRRADADLRLEAKRMKFNTSHACCEANLGVGDGKDSYTDAGNFTSSDSIQNPHDDDGHVVDNATQTFLPLPPGAVPKPVIKLRICVKSLETSDILCFELISGAKHHLHQLVQHLKNAMSR